MVLLLLQPSTAAFYYYKVSLLFVSCMSEDNKRTVSPIIKDEPTAITALQEEEEEEEAANVDRARTFFEQASEAALVRLCDSRDREITAPTPDTPAEATARAEAQAVEQQVLAIIARRDPVTGQITLTKQELDWLLQTGNISRVVDFDLAV